MSKFKEHERPFYRKDGTLERVAEMDPEQFMEFSAKKPRRMYIDAARITYYYEDGITIKRVSDYTPGLNVAFRSTHYRNDGTRGYMTECDPETPEKGRESVYSEDGTILKTTMEFIAKTKVVTKLTRYRQDCTREMVLDMDPKTGYAIKETRYRQDCTREMVLDIDPKGDTTKNTHYYEDGTTVSKIYEMDSITGVAVKAIGYREDGTLESIEERDPHTLETLSKTIYNGGGEQST